MDNKNFFAIETLLSSLSKHSQLEQLSLETITDPLSTLFGVSPEYVCLLLIFKFYLLHSYNNISLPIHANAFASPLQIGKKFKELTIKEPRYTTSKHSTSKNTESSQTNDHSLTSSLPIKFLGIFSKVL